MMIYTNKYKLPESLYKALIHDNYEHRGDISVTGLIKSPRMFQLEKRHDHEIVIDCSENLWVLQGKAIHSLLEKADDKDALQEEPLIQTMNGWNIAAKPDIWKDEIITDWKYTSVYAFLLGDKIDWERQLQMYQWFYEEEGFKVKKLRIYAILRDWMESKLLRDKDYPPIPFMEKKIETKSHEEMNEIILQRVMEHQEAVDLPDNELPPCLPYEKWAKDTKWAVMKNGRKTAVRVFDEESKAQDFLIKEDKDYNIIKRPGDQWVRCRKYCNARQFCNHFQEQLKLEKE
jgi:hypothetical protein